MTCTILLNTAFATVCLLAQGAGGDVAAPEISPWQRVLSSPFLLIAGPLLLFYVLMILPERRKQAEKSKRLAVLKKNDRVVTVGGIHGVVVSAPADSDVVTLRIDEGSNVRLRVSRSAIANVLGDAGGLGESKETNKT